MSGNLEQTLIQLSRDKLDTTYLFETSAALQQHKEGTLYDPLAEAYIRRPREDFKSHEALKAHIVKWTPESRQKMN